VKQNKGYLKTEQASASETKQEIPENRTSFSKRNKTRDTLNRTSFSKRNRTSTTAVLKQTFV
jgi:hypothetical protein